MGKILNCQTLHLQFLYGFHFLTEFYSDRQKANGSDGAPIAFPCTVHVQTLPLRIGHTFLDILPIFQNNSHLCPSFSV